MMQQMLLAAGLQWSFELVENPTFNTGNNWTEPVDWNITGGKAVHSAGIGVLIGNLRAMDNNWELEVTFTLSDFVGTEGVYFTVAGETGTTRVANGTYVETIPDTSTELAEIHFHPVNATDTFSIDEVHIRRRYY